MHKIVLAEQTQKEKETVLIEVEIYIKLPNCNKDLEDLKFMKD